MAWHMVWRMVWHMAKECDDKKNVTTLIIQQKNVTTLMTLPHINE